MKLVVCVVHNRDKGKIGDELLRAGFKFTVIASSGGFLREGNTTLMIGAEDDEVSGLMSIVSQNCKSRDQVLNVMPLEAGATGAFIPSPVKVPVGGAVVFVMDVERFERF